MNTGNKYHRTIHGLHGGPSTVIDVYSVLSAFNVTSPGIQHAVKKLLCAGLRGKADVVTDLVEARDAIERAIDDARREAIEIESRTMSMPCSKGCGFCMPCQSNGVYPSHELGEAGA